MSESTPDELHDMAVRDDEALHADEDDLRDMADWFDDSDFWDKDPSPYDGDYSEM